ncbi:MAG: hypothetical protein R3E96_02690 [Planctomycetota bacterium]
MPDRMGSGATAARGTGAEATRTGGRRPWPAAIEINYDALSPSGKLDYRLYERQLLRDLEGFQWRLHSYPVNQMHGEHLEGPNLLLNVHA